MRTAPIIAAGLLAAACARVETGTPILRNGSRLPAPAEQVEDIRTAYDAEFRAILARRDSVAAEALRTCAGTICAAMARGEIALRMTPGQVMAATRTSPEAWTVRENGPVGVMAPRLRDHLPRDAAGDVDLVQLHGGLVIGFSYREVQGIRVVASADDTTAAARVTWLADALIREGDELAAAGRFDAALDRYDRADVLRSARPPLLDYKIARILDLQLSRPWEAELRYRRFLHQLEQVPGGDGASVPLAAAADEARERLGAIGRRTAP